MQPITLEQTNNYSLDTMLRYAFAYEVQNYLNLNPNVTHDPKLTAVLEYLEARIQEISQKYK